MDKNLLAKYISFRPAWKAFGPYYLGVLIFAIGPQVNPDAQISPALSQLIATCFLAFILIKRFTNHYRIESGELIWLRSFPGSHEGRAKIENITRIDLRRGILQRMMGVAHVHVYVDQGADPVVKLFGVAEPDKFKALLMEMGAGDTPVYGAWRR